MSQQPQGLSDIHILGDATESVAICSMGSDEPDWLRGSPVFTLLSQHHILHAGIMSAQQSFEVVRSDQSGTFFLACFAGSGSILSDGGWKSVEAGEACLLPPHTINAPNDSSKSSWTSPNKNAISNSEIEASDAAFFGAF